MSLAAPTNHAISIRSRARSLGGLAVLLASALLVQAPFTLADVGDRNLDFNAHYAWAVQFAAGLGSGDPYPHWMWRGQFGLGEPALLFYSPLFYYLCGLIRQVTPNTWEAMRIVFVLSTTIAGFYAWRLLRLFTGNVYALAGAVVLQWSPMIFMVYYWYNDFPWAVGFAALVALTYYLVRPAALQRPVDIPVSLAIAILVLTHVLSAVMALICFSFMCLYFIIRGWENGGGFTRQVMSWFASAGFGLALSMFYLLPALASMHLISSGVWTTKWTPWSNFAFPILTAFAFGMRWFSFQWTMPVVVLLSVVAATLHLRWHRDQSNRLREAMMLLLVVSWVSLFFSSELSFPLWLLHTPLRMVQFPSRFIYITAATGPIANLLALVDLRRTRGSAWRMLVVVAPLVLSVAATALLNAKFALIDGKPLHLSVDETKVYLGLPEYELRTQGDHWQDYYRGGGFAAECAKKMLACAAVETNSRVQIWNVSGTHPDQLRLPLFAFPAWQVTIDGAAVPYATDSATGLITIDLPAGTHRVVASWSRLWSEWLGLGISGLAVLILAILGLSRRLAASVRCAR